MVWQAQSCCGQLGGTTRDDVKPTEAPKSPASTQLESVEVCRGQVFACSKVREQWLSLGQIAAECQFVVRWEELGRRRGRSELGRGYWHHTGGLSSCGAPNRCMEGTRGELIRLYAFKPAET